MIYEKKHPLHDAIVQSGHINHNHAMRRYSSLMRRAWDPAARTIPVQPARDAGNKNDREATSRPAHESPLTTAARGQTPTLARADRSTVPSSASRRLSHTNDRDAGATALLHAPAGHRTTYPQEPVGGAVNPVMGPIKAPKQTEMPGTSVTPPGRGLPSERAWEHELSNLVESHRPLTPDVLADREESAQQAGYRAAAARRGDPNAGDPPFAIDPDVYADAKAVVEARDDLTDAEKYIFLGLVGYEGLGYDRAGSSLGGITSDTFDDLKSVVSAMRELQGKGAIAATTVDDLSIDEMIDFQRAYLVRRLTPNDTLSARQVLDSAIMEQLGSNVLAFQIADIMFNYRFETRPIIFQYAVNETIRQMSDAEREDGGYQMLAMDKTIGPDTLGVVQTLANDPAHQTRFLQILRLARVWWTLKQGTYSGNNRWRIWGITRDR